MKFVMKHNTQYTKLRSKNVPINSRTSKLNCYTETTFTSNCATLLRLVAFEDSAGSRPCSHNTYRRIRAYMIISLRVGAPSWFRWKDQQFYKRRWKGFRFFYSVWQPQPIPTLTIIQNVQNVQYTVENNICTLETFFPSNKTPVCI
jgi:hypothetical protein